MSHGQDVPCKDANAVKLATWFIQPVAIQCLVLTTQLCVLRRGGVPNFNVLWNRVLQRRGIRQVSPLHRMRVIGAMFRWSRRALLRNAEGFELIGFCLVVSITSLSALDFVVIE